MPTRTLVVIPEGQLDVLPGVRECLRGAQDIQPFILLSDPWSRGEADRLRRMIRSLRPDGILAYMLPTTESAFRDSGCPVVCLGDGVDSPRPTVRMDQQAIGRLAAEHLVQQGVRHLAFAAIEGWFHGRLRWEGFRQAALAAGMQAHLADTFKTGDGEKSRALRTDWLLRWIAQLPKPVGIHFRDTALTLRAWWACGQLGLNVPEEVALVAGEDNFLWRQLDAPAMSAIETDRHRLGFEAMALLCRLLRGGRLPRTPVLIPPVRVVCRESSDRLAIRDPLVAEFRRRIREQVHRPLTVKEVLSGLPCSRRTLERHIARVLHRTLHQEIEAAHMERARRLLKETTLSLGAIARASGYRSYRVFSEAFRRYTGTTPSQYRARQFEAQHAGAGGFSWMGPGKSEV